MTLVAERIALTQLVTPGGNPVTYACRHSTSDQALAYGIIGEDEYGLRDKRFDGWAIDIGAHIGLVSAALALDNHGLQVVAVEAIPANAELIRRTVEINGLEDRVFIETAAAAADDATTVDITYGWSRADNQPDHYMTDNRYIGEIVGPNETSTTIACPALGLQAILDKYEIDRVALLKIDCEGCEWSFLTSPAVERCDRILGEYHDGPGYAGVLDLLGPTHDVTHIRGTNVGIFDAVRR